MFYANSLRCLEQSTNFVVGPSIIKTASPISSDWRSLTFKHTTNLSVLVVLGVCVQHFQEISKFSKISKKFKILTNLSVLVVLGVCGGGGRGVRRGGVTLGGRVVEVLWGEACNI